MQQSAIIQGVDTLHGVVPKEWLRRDRMVIDNSKVAVAIYHRPSVMGHLVVFPKAHCARLEDADPEVFSALGMMLPVVKRAIRLCTGYRSCGIVLQSGDQTGQAVPHLYFEVQAKPARGSHLAPALLCSQRGLTVTIARRWFRRARRVETFSLSGTRMATGMRVESATSPSFRQRPCCGQSARSFLCGAPSR